MTSSSSGERRDELAINQQYVSVVRAAIDSRSDVRSRVCEVITSKGSASVLRIGGHGISLEGDSSGNPTLDTTRVADAEGAARITLPGWMTRNADGSVTATLIITSVGDVTLAGVTPKLDTVEKFDPTFDYFYTDDEGRGEWISRMQRLTIATENDAYLKEKFPKGSTNKMWISLLIAFLTYLMSPKGTDSEKRQALVRAGLAGGAAYAATEYTDWGRDISDQFDGAIGATPGGSTDSDTTVTTGQKPTTGSGLGSIGNWVTPTIAAVGAGAVASSIPKWVIWAGLGLGVYLILKD